MIAASKQWAYHCLDTYRDTLLERGLAISRAIADFMSEMETP